MRASAPAVMWPGMSGVTDSVQRLVVFHGASILREPIQEPLDGCAEFWQVIADRGRKNGVTRVKVAVSEPVAHAGNLLPRHLGLRIGHIVRQVLYRLTDLDEPYSDGVEHQPISEGVVNGPAGKVVGNDVGGSEDVAEPVGRGPLTTPTRHARWLRGRPA